MFASVKLKQMISSFIGNIARYAAVFLTIGLVVWFEALYTIEWSSPYCTSQEDGPAYAAFGMPLPYAQFSGVSSTEYDFMPHIYFLNIVMLSAFLFPGISWMIDRFPKTRTLRFIVGATGLGLLVARVFLFVFLNTLIPAFSIGDDYEPYMNFRPVGFGNNFWHYDCRPSHYWFPNGWKHD